MTPGSEDPSAPVSPAPVRRTVTIRDVARHAKVSVTTVSRVLSDSSLVAAPTRERVERAIDELDFVVNAHARALSGGPQRIVACLVPEMVNASFAALAGGIEAEATAAGCLFMLSTTHGDHERERAIIDSVCEQRAQAVIIAGAAHDGSQYHRRMTDYAAALERTGARLVLCARPNLPDVDSIGWVGYDDDVGAYAVTEHLIALGHTRILVAGNNGATTADSRLRGHYRALQDAGLPIDHALAPRAKFTSDGGQEVVRVAVADRVEFTAVFGLADHIAVGALRALRAAGLRIPEDVSLAGFDDIPLVSDLTPPLTSVGVDFRAVGRRAARLGLGIADPTDREASMFRTQLVVRESTATPRARLSHRIEVGGGATGSRLRGR